ncbi:MAG TPA: hypothetical protein VI636_22435, partial [Candidatus Angelobacter sp.]
MSPDSVIQPGHSFSYRRKQRATGSGRKQPAIKRKGFQRRVITGVPVRLGQHRRHIISSHLMLMAIQAWVNAHNGDGELEKLKKAGGAQALHDRLNNNIKNLIAGPGAENSAIGMFTNYVGRLLSTSERLSARDIRKKLERPTGFQQEMQKRLTRQAVRIITNDFSVYGSKSTIKVYLRDLQDSTDFDWPKGARPEHYDKWQGVYNRFWSVYNHAA